MSREAAFPVTQVSGSSFRLSLRIRKINSVNMQSNALHERGDYHDGFLLFQKVAFLSRNLEQLAIDAALRRISIEN